MKITDIKDSVAQEITKGKVVTLGDDAVNHGLSLVVVDNNFIYYGDCITDTTQCIITDGFNVRRWEGKKGLGHYAVNGMDDTVTLDEAGTIWAPIGEVNHIIICQKAR